MYKRQSATISTLVITTTGVSTPATLPTTLNTITPYGTAGAVSRTVTLTGIPGYFGIDGIDVLQLSQFAQTAIHSTLGNTEVWNIAVSYTHLDVYKRQAFSFFASAGAVVRAGARPVFADIDPHTLNLDPAQVEPFLRGSQRDKLRALLPVHLYGQCADMDAFHRLAEEFHLSLIEDAAQTIWSALGKRAE